MVIGLIIVVMVLVALVPTLVLLDLAGGGDGWGLCRGGLASCRAAYFEGPELLAGLVVLLFLLLMLLRLAFYFLRRFEARHSSMGGGDGLGGG